MSEHRMQSDYGGVAQGNTEKAGGTRYSSGKPTMTWSPWLGMMEVCRVSTMGAKKYAPLDWLAGQSFSTLMSSAMRHMLKAATSPLARDEDSGLLHLGHAAWNILAALHFIEQGRDHLFDDVTCWHGCTASTDGATWRGAGDTPVRAAQYEPGQSGV